MESGGWSESYGYDRHGNRWVSGRNGLPALPSDVPTASSAYSLGNNRVAATSYDSAGNRLDWTFWTSAYDANNHVTQAAHDNGSLRYAYGYDGDGRRVKKVREEYSGGQWSAAETTVFVYNAFGVLAAEYTDKAVTESGTEYFTADHLGSTRLVTDGQGNVLKRLDYLPFGEDQYAGIGQRSTALGFAVDPAVVPQSNSVLFTGQYRDSETNLDYFGARYFASAMGRFTSADPILLMDQKLVDPQQWNMFSYVRNNPLRLIDPTGKYVCSGTQSECEAFEKQRQVALKSKNTDVSSGAAAYGDAGKENGVTVGFVDPKGKPDWKNKAGNATASLGVDPDDPTKFRANVDVQIKKGQSGVALRDTIAHEGTHTRDAQAFAATATMGGQYDLSKNLTVWQTEMNAYGVSAAVWSEAGRTAQFGTCGGGPCSFGPGMNAASVRATSILLLASPQNGYTRFIYVGGQFVNHLGLRQFPAITTPAPKP